MRSISNYTGQGNIILRDRQLNFNNLVAVITDSRIQEDTLTLIYYSEETQAAAKAAGISVQSNTGNLTFTAASTPSMPVVCDIVLLSANIVNQVANASDIDYNNTTSGLTATDVQGAVDEVAIYSNAILSVTGFNDAFQFQKIGKIVFLTYNGDASNLPKGGLSFSETIPSAYRPKMQTRIYSVDTSATGDSTAVMLVLNTDGSISGYRYGSAISAATQCRFGTISYIAAT